MRTSEWMTVTGILLVLAVIAAVDILVDSQEGASLRHLSVEICLLWLCLGGIGYLAILWRRTRTTLATTRANLVDTRQDLVWWKKEAERYLAGLGVTIDTQFERWGLTFAEKEVGLLILKGVSFKEIALLRGTAERTVRHQAQAIYRKADLANRSEFSAFFLEDLLLPNQDQYATSQTQNSL